MTVIVVNKAEPPTELDDVIDRRAFEKVVVAVRNQAGGNALCGLLEHGAFKSDFNGLGACDFLKAADIDEKVDSDAVLPIVFDLHDTGLVQRVRFGDLLKNHQTLLFEVDAVVFERKDTGRAQKVRF